MLAFDRCHDRPADAAALPFLIGEAVPIKRQEMIGQHAHRPTGWRRDLRRCSRDHAVEFRIFGNLHREQMPAALEGAPNPEDHAVRIGIGGGDASGYRSRG